MKRTGGRDAVNAEALDAVRTIEGPFWKSPGHDLSKDGDNPEAPWPGYGWPLGTECWYFVVMSGWRRRWWTTGSSVAKALERLEDIL
jgi:hypothetical protein